MMKYEQIEASKAFELIVSGDVCNLYFEDKVFRELFLFSKFKWGSKELKNLKFYLRTE